MNKLQKIFIASSVGLTILLFVLGRTIPTNKDAKPHTVEHNTNGNAAVSFDELLNMYKKRLSPSILQLIEGKERELASLKDTNQKIEGYRSLARLWRDSTELFVPFAKYTAEAAKLENSEKNLNFAAQLLLDQVLSIQEKPLQTWMAREAREIFEQQLLINPDNDSVKIGLGTCYFFGATKEGEAPMKGVMLIREIAERNPDNAYAQRMLGIGAAVSGQKEKAIERFLTVHRLEPDNMDVLLNLINLYKQSGNKTEEKKWNLVYLNVIRRLEKEKKITLPDGYIPNLEKHIKTLDN